MDWTKLTDKQLYIALAMVGTLLDMGLPGHYSLLALAGGLEQEQNMRAMDNDYAHSDELRMRHELKEDDINDMAKGER